MHSNRCIEIDVQTRYVQDGSLQRTWLLSRVGRSRHSLDRASGVDHGDVEELGRGDADIRQTPRHVQQVSQPLASRIDAVAAGQGLVIFSAHTVIELKALEGRNMSSGLDSQIRFVDLEERRAVLLDHMDILISSF